MERTDKLVRHGKWLKHVIDRMVALLAAPVYVPTVAMVAAAIATEDVLSGEGLQGVFHREPRISADREFSMVKFRTLKASVYADRRKGGLATVKDAERDSQHLTRIGGFLIRFYLDEMPQLLHILSGQMSFVGPRPVWPHDTPRRTYFAPYKVRGGLAGTFQHTKGEREIFAADKVYLEEYAARGQLSLLAYDVNLVGKTLRKMLRGEGL
ncbi:sugar transferase [Planctomycetota bacterium]